MPIEPESLPSTPMALSLRNSSSRGLVGLDIDDRFLAAVQADGTRITQAASTELEGGLVRDGEVVDVDGLGAALKDFAARAGLPKNVRLGVANQQIVVRLVQLPRIENDAERDAAIRFQAAEAIAMPLDEAVLDHQIAAFDEDEDGTKRMRVVLVAARRAMVEAYAEAAKKAGLRPQGIDLDAFALMRVLAGSENGEAARVYCHLATVTNLAIGLSDSCLFTRPLSTGWQEEHAAASLADEIRLSIDYYMAQPNAQPVSEGVLSGPGSRDTELVEGLATHLGIPVQVAEPLGRLDTSGLSPDDDPFRYTVAAGLAMEQAA
jgi:type IV pilus assembly protein PilM